MSALLTSMSRRIPLATAAGGNDPLGGRPEVGGKFLFDGEAKLYVRGVTYGTFRPVGDGSGYPDPRSVEADFLRMGSSGVNALRTYSVPPRWLLDLAMHHGLRVMIGLPWEQHVAFLDDSSLTRSIEWRVREGVRACAAHPAVLCYAVGNEIPAPIVRWHGRKRIERFLRRLYEAAKDEDPAGLVTYVNYPTTEYLDLPFLDLHCFNVYLEERERLEAYLARLHNLAGEKPLLMTEIGLDSRRHGEEAQAQVLDWQLRAAFGSGCAGAFVFAWTDEWHRGGYEVEDWDFGITDRERRPKTALCAVRRAFSAAPLGHVDQRPRISVVVCTHNGERTLRDCFDGLRSLDYPDYEVIVVNDGSTDATIEITQEYGYHLINTPNRGLSSARNSGLEAATGEIVAYLDSDARPDRHWLAYLAAAFAQCEHVGIGGPNVAPPGDGMIAECVASSPGGPVHVLLSDREAEHIPGCNMAFRTEALEAIGGFDPRFRAAGDDVDVCWRLQQRGWTLGFSPAAMVWHHPRDSVRAYWKQQRGYGKAEALLERKWPEKYNGAGHFSWRGRLYGSGLPHALSRRWRVYYGTWGSGLFQRMYEGEPPTLATLALMPEWYMLVAALAALSACGFLWAPLLFVLPLFAAAALLPPAQALASARRAVSRAPGATGGARGARRLAVTACLYLTQPMMRLWGRLRHGLTPWRSRGPDHIAFPRRRSWTIWSESWRPLEGWIAALEAGLLEAGAVVRRGGHFDRWDLEVRGFLGSGRLWATVEEHGEGKQLVRFRSQPRVGRIVLFLVAVLAAAAAATGWNGAPAPAVMLGLIAVSILIASVRSCARTTAAVMRGVERAEREIPVDDGEPLRPLRAAGSVRNVAPRVGRA
jgi:O-antigen biosynthesis protein